MDDRFLWREEGSELLQRCGIFDLCRSLRTAADGRSASFYLLQAPAWVNVVPVLEGEPGAERLLMVRQYRQGIQRTTVEFPAGLVEPGEDPQEAAVRELAEETGYRARSLRRIGHVAPNPAFMSNWCTTFCAEGLTAGSQRPDPLGHRGQALRLPPGHEHIQPRPGAGDGRRRPRGRSRRPGHDRPDRAGH